MIIVVVLRLTCLCHCKLAGCRPPSGEAPGRARREAPHEVPPWHSSMSCVLFISFYHLYFVFAFAFLFIFCLCYMGRPHTKFPVGMDSLCLCSLLAFVYCSGFSSSLASTHSMHLKDSIFKSSSLCLSSLSFFSSWQAGFNSSLLFCYNHLNMWSCFQGDL